MYCRPRQEPLPRIVWRPYSVVSSVSVFGAVVDWSLPLASLQARGVRRSKREYDEMISMLTPLVSRRCLCAPPARVAPAGQRPPPACGPARMAGLGCGVLGRAPLARDAARSACCRE